MSKLDLNKIPAWVYEKQYGRGTTATAACILAISAGSAAIVKETEKAVLISWGNTELVSGPSGGEFWVAKSLMR